MARLSGLLMIHILFQCMAWAQDPITIDKATWLAGCWNGGGEQREITEVWMKPSGKSMLGMSRTVKAGKMVEHEFLQILQQENGEIHFVAQPSGQPKASFTLISKNPKELIFENPQHDFPQRVIYKLADDGSLAARIEGKIDGKDRTIDFPMKRTTCE